MGSTLYLHSAYLVCVIWKPLFKWQLIQYREKRESATQYWVTKGQVRSNLPIPPSVYGPEDKL